MIVQETTALLKIKSLTKRIRIVQGGTSASKTISCIAYLIAYAQVNPGTSISIVSETFPHLKRGAMRDFLSIMEDHKYYKESEWNRTDSIYRFPNGSFIEFFGADQSEKVRGPRRDVLFVNEGNNITFETFTQLEIRTRDIILIDFNPISVFWLHDQVIPNVDHDFLTLTYKDNEALSQEIIDSIESKQHNENWFRVYGLGLMGELMGQILTNWDVIDELPEDAKFSRYGMDFGYTNDPSVILAMYEWNGGLIYDEVLFERGQKNKQLANAIRLHSGLEPVSDDNTYTGQTQILTVADSAEPKSIDEIESYGVKITGAAKGPDSVNNGIQLLQDRRIYITKQSVNTIKSVRNYLWKVDKRTDKPLNVPEHEFSHAPDAMRYPAQDLFMPSEYGIYF